MKTYEGLITELEEHQVFVFGSNLDGFHGGGSAGFASFGVPGNIWRSMHYDTWPKGERGVWNIKGQGEGYQEGTDGRSYALPTVVKAGQPRSISKHGIIKNILKFYLYAAANTDKEFLVAYTMAPNLNGYTPKEMVEMFGFTWPPANVVFEKTFASHFPIEYHTDIKEL